MSAWSYPPFISSPTQDLDTVGALSYLGMNGFQHRWLWSLADVVSNAGSTIKWPQWIIFFSETHFSPLRNEDNSVCHTEFILRVG